MTKKLRLRLSLIAGLPEPVLLERLPRLPKADLIAFRHRYGIRECCMTGRCRIKFLRTIGWQLGDNSSSSQTRCQCVAARQAVPPIPFAAHQLLAKLLKAPQGERGSSQPRSRPNRRRTARLHAA